MREWCRYKAIIMPIIEEMVPILKAIHQTQEIKRSRQLQHMKKAWPARDKWNKERKLENLTDNEFIDDRITSHTSVVALPPEAKNFKKGHYDHIIRAKALKNNESDNETLLFDK